MTIDVTHFPSMDWVKNIPDYVSVRAMKVGDDVIAALWNEQHQSHVCFRIEDGERSWGVALESLKEAIFDAEYPGQQSGMMARMLAATAGAKFPPEGDRPLWARRCELFGVENPFGSE